MSFGRVHKKSSLLVLAGLALLLPPTGQAAPLVCSSESFDSDNDGWGWENNATCIVNADDTETFSSTRTQTYCRFLSSDDDADGWGWENNSSCIINEESGAGNELERNSGQTVVLNNEGKTVCQTENADPDGDGYGWEYNASCVVAGRDIETVTTKTKPDCVNASADPDGDGYGWENNTSCLVTAGTGTGTTNKQEYIAGDITDLVLITGQSNTLGAGTTVSSSLDVKNNRVFAYTSEGWQVADLYQSWDQGSNPGNGDANSPLDARHNNFALHFGKQLAALDSKRVTGFILVSEPGEGISHWDLGATGMNRILTKVVSAINDLPHKSALDGILWHQGETDWLLEGTSDPDASQPAPVNYYPAKLGQLINNLRSQNWFNNTRPFICGETASATGVNTHLMALNTDDDTNTACVEGFGLAARSDGSHFTAESLRAIGGRYANRYFEMTSP